jgi:1-acyl-sn-glycerol-3-phosphate acyltransferase
VRYLLEFVGTMLLKLLSRTAVYGADRIPTSGPFIVAGNHRAVMEVFLMLAVTRPHVDIIGSGDFPLDPKFRFLALWYGYIPYRRGSVDGRALRRAVTVLRNGGVVGIFPEGGIWTEGPKETQRGVAWLAAQSGAPVVPIGFAGIDAGVERVLKLEFPRFEVHVGNPRRFTGDEVTRSRLDDFSGSVMEEIEALIPAWDRTLRPIPVEDEYSLILRWNGHEQVRSDPAAAILSRFYHLPVLLSIFEVNLRRDVRALRAWNEPRAAAEIQRAVQRVLGYLRLRNRRLFTYRLGSEHGRRLERAFEELRDWLAEHPGELVQIVPVRRVVWPDGRTEVCSRP